MKKKLHIFLIIAFVVACKSKAVYNRSKTSTHTSTTVRNPKVKSIIKDAKSYLGTKYKYGGNTKKGMDCSGLVQTVFRNHNIELPRSSKNIASKGNWIDVKNVAVGDLVFFATRKNSRVINHVGIVTSVNNNDFEFIHSSSSRGVIISSLKQKYWYQAYVQARRVL